MSKEKIHQKLTAIIRFADIGRFIDAPLFTYSSGMKLRLGFAIAIHADPDILILDEGFNVGDKNFQRKTQKKMSEFFQNNGTTVFVTHSMEFVKKHCTRVIILDKGNTLKDGRKNIISYYLNRTIKSK